MEQFLCPSCHGKFMLHYTVESQKRELERKIEYLKSKQGRIFKDKNIERMIRTVKEDLESRKFKEFWYCSNCSYTKPSPKNIPELQADVKNIDWEIKQEYDHLKARLEAVEIQKKALLRMIQDMEENPSVRKG